MATKHVVEVESIDDYRGGEFKEDLNFFHKKCGGGKIAVKNQVDGPLSNGALLHCVGCRMTVVSVNSKQIREIVALARNGDNGDCSKIENKHKQKVVKFILTSK